MEKIKRIKGYLRDAERHLDETNLSNARTMLSHALRSIKRDDLNEMAHTHKETDVRWEAIKKRAKQAERIVAAACLKIVKNNRDKFGRSIRSERSGQLDNVQIDVLLGTTGSLGIEIQVKSTDGAIHDFYKKQRNRRMLAVNPYHYDGNITAQTFTPILERLVLYAIEHPYELPCEWYYKKEYTNNKAPF